MPPIRARALGCLLLAASTAACSALLSNGVQAHREGDVVTISMPGRTDPTTQAWLCPAEPPPGEVWGPEGGARLRGLGCLDLGLSTLAPGQTGWSASIDVVKLRDAGPPGFAPGATYRLILVSSQDNGLSIHGTSADVPPFSIAP